MRRKRLAGAERQARYRERHLGVEGERARLNMIVPAMTSGRLKRLARYWGVSQVEALERALGDAERRVLAKATAQQEREYYDDVTQ